MKKMGISMEDVSLRDLRDISLRVENKEVEE